MAIQQDRVREALARVPYPGFSRDIVSFGVVHDVAVDGAVVTIRLQVGPGDTAVVAPLRAAVTAAVAALDGVDRVEVRVATGSPTDGLGMVGSPPPSVARSGGLDAGLTPGVHHIVAVASGKGGVGKSTVAVNLAIALAKAGARTGLLDADVYGPSIPMMMGVDEQPKFDPERQALIPFERHGVRFMSLGFLVDPDTAVIWRGPMVMKAIEQLLGDVAWGDLDILVVDMPPGTGDAQLTLAQKVSLAGAIIVSTPQDVALADAIKGVAMFKKVDVPVLGIVENMSYFACPHCQERTEIFGHGGARKTAGRLGVPFLGEIPLDPAVRTGGDEGRPIVVQQESGPQHDAFENLARGLLDRLD